MVANPFRKTDANPDVVDASVLEPTQYEHQTELDKHSDFERETGVREEELDTRPVVDADPGDGKTFAERTSNVQPWAEYQEEANRKTAEQGKATQKETEELTKEDQK